MSSAPIAVSPKDRPRRWFELKAKNSTAAHEYSSRVAAPLGYQPLNPRKIGRQLWVGLRRQAVDW